MTLEGRTQFLTQLFGVRPQPAEDKSIPGSTRFEEAFWATLFQAARNSLILKWRNVRVVEGARLESDCRGNSTVGSNPTLSANLRSRVPTRAIYGWQASGGGGFGPTDQQVAVNDEFERELTGIAAEYKQITDK